MTRKEYAIEHVQKSMEYVRELIDSFERNEWFRMPAEPVTHLAWQVGHIPIAEYALLLRRVRGPRPEDEQLLPESFRKRFGRGSVPVADPAQYPPIEEMLDRMESVHREGIEVLRGVADEELDQPPAEPHQRFSTKLGAVWFCGQHTMMHAGQIGLLRRLLGKPPLR